MNKGKTKTGAIFGKKPFQGQRKGPKAVIPNAAAIPTPAPMPGMAAGGAVPMGGKAKKLAMMMSGMPDTDSDMM